MKSKQVMRTLVLALSFCLAPWFPVPAGAELPESGPATAPAALAPTTAPAGTPLPTATEAPTLLPTATEDPTLLPTATEDPGGELTKLLAYALIILVLGAAAMVLARRYASVRALTKGKAVRVLESTYLGPRKTLHLVQVGTRQILLSSTRDHVRMLADVSGGAPEQDGAGAGEEETDAR